MASEKRKAVGEARPSKKPKIASTNGDKVVADKGRLKPEKAEKSTAKPERSTEKRPAAKSILLQEEKSFPRGGAGVLTPLEHKQIRNQAERDVLFEQQSGQKVDGLAEDDDFFKDSTAPAKKTGKNKKRQYEHEKKDQDGAALSKARIHGLTYKSLQPGCIVLGRIIDITTKDIALSLPNNLTGIVPITSISQALTQRIEKLLEEAQDGDSEEDVELKKIFTIGQWLRAVVVETQSADGKTTGKRHIELSTDPALVNAQLEVDNISTNSYLQASVRSIEDHGVILDLGLTSKSITGFVSRKELGSAYKLDQLQQGQVMLCIVSGRSGKVIKLTPDTTRFPTSAKSSSLLTTVPSVELLLPGCAVEVLITTSSKRGVIGSVIGMVDVMADFIHSGVEFMSVQDITTKLKIGSKVKARIIWSTLKDDGNRDIGVSLLEHMLFMPGPSLSTKTAARSEALEQVIASSTFVHDATVAEVVADRGIFFDLPSIAGKKIVRAFVHISQITDDHMAEVPTSSNKYRIGSVHKFRVLNFNPLDNLYYGAMKESIMSQPFLRLEDLEVGQIVEAKVEKLILGKGTDGIAGVLIKLANHITAFVPSTHMSDIILKNPERKFKEGTAVRGRVLSVDLEKRQAKVTLKKSFLNESEAAIWTSFHNLEKGAEGRGTIVKLLDKGAVVMYFGDVRAFLPISQFSDTPIEQPSKHFQLGQSVLTRVLQVDAEKQEMVVSCRIGGTMTADMKLVWDNIQPGQILSTSITSKTSAGVEVEIEGGVRGLVRLGHLLDGSAKKAASMLEKLSIGKKLNDLVVLSKSDSSQQVVLSHKASLVEAAKQDRLVKNVDDVTFGQELVGYVQNITPEGVFVEFAGRVFGRIPKLHLSSELIEQPQFGLRNDQSIKTWLLSKDESTQRFALTMRENAGSAATNGNTQTGAILSNPVDSTLKSISDVSMDKIVQVKVRSIKESQINVQLSDGVQGRIDVSEVFDDWKAIKNKQSPLQDLYKPNDVVSAKVLGLRDARGHQFLAFTGRHRGHTVVELSIKSSRLNQGDKTLLTGMSELKEGQVVVGFVNNVMKDCVYVTLSPTIKGRIALMDLADELLPEDDIEKRYPIGSAHQLKIKNVNAEAGQLSLTARLSNTANAKLDIESLNPGLVIPGRVSKVGDTYVIVDLSDDLYTSVPLTELADDFDEAKPSNFSKNETVRTRVLKVDPINKKIWLTLRPSLTLSSSLPVRDSHISSIANVKEHQLVRGFVRHVAEKGIWVSLSGIVDGFVRVSDISDDYIKDWQKHLSIGQLITARVITVNTSSNSVLLSLKKTDISKNYKPAVKFDELAEGMTVTGKVHKVMDFGVFVKIDSTRPEVQGLAHRSEIAEKRVADVRGLYEEGDKVKAKILKINATTKKIDLGLKASYFKNAEESDGEDDVDGVVLPDENEDLIEVDEDDSDDGVALDEDVDMDELEDAEDDADAMEVDEVDEPQDETVPGLSTNGFDWSGDVFAQDTSEANETKAPKKKRSKAASGIDMTDDLDKHGPQNTSDFERQLLGQPNDSALWIQYMAFHLQLSEIQKARDIADRALRTIHIRETDEKLNIYIARLNLEVEYGEDAQIEEVFKQACQMQDSLQMHEKLASIYIGAGKHEKAADIFDRVVRNKTFRASPEVWLNYATFLMTQLDEPDRARALLSRALQSIPQTEHRLLTAKFAALEFRTTSGDAERGRTIFEGLVTEWPKWTTGWDMWADIERGRILQSFDKAQKQEAIGQVRDLFERMSRAGMKKKRARFVFTRWLEFEEELGGEKEQEKVKSLAKEFVEKLQAKGDEE